MSKKLISKTGNNKPNVSIAGLTAKIRGEEEPVIKDSTKEFVSDEKKKSITKKISNDNPVIEGLKSEDDEFLTFLQEVKKRDYSSSEVIYVDSEIKEIFTMLKAKRKISISALTSYILEQWVLENEDAISLILKNNNRFL